MMFSWNHNKSAGIQSVNPVTHFQLDTAVLVCDTFLVFENDTAVYQWAVNILKEINPALQLTPKAKVEAIVGYRGNQQTMHTNMQDLANLLLTRMGLPPAKHVIKFFETERRAPRMRIWCAVALQLYPATEEWFD